MVAGQSVDILGPLGKGFPVDEVTENDQVLIVGGGIGVPPLYELAKQLSKKAAILRFCSDLHVRKSRFLKSSSRSSLILR